MSVTFLTAPELTAALVEAGIDDGVALLALWPSEHPSSLRAEVELEVEGTCGRFYLKSYRYAGWRKARGLIGRGTLYGTPPEINEFNALTWLRAHDIPAVRPVAAAARTGGLRLQAHALLTEYVPGAPDLASRLADAEDPLVHYSELRSAVAEELGRHLARMHGQGFVHRDCHARNILMRVDSPQPRIWFLDCRRAGHGSAPRAQLHDLACLRLDLRPAEGAVFTANEWTHLLRAYLGSDQGTVALDARLAEVAETERARREARAAKRARRQTPRR